VIDLSDVLAAVPGAVVLQEGRTRFGRASTDTRDVGGGELFFAVPGPLRDGHDFVATAVARGAAGLVVSRELGELGQEGSGPAVNKYGILWNSQGKGVVE